jgi:hypothetical protein
MRELVQKLLNGASPHQNEVRIMRAEPGWRFVVEHSEDDDYRALDLYEVVAWKCTDGGSIAPIGMLENGFLWDPTTDGVTRIVALVPPGMASPLEAKAQVDSIELPQQSSGTSPPRLRLVK